MMQLIKFWKIVRLIKVSNDIPGSAVFALDLRTQTNELMDELECKVKCIFKAVESLYGVEVKVMNNVGVAAANVDEDTVHLMGEAIKKVLGKNNVAPPLVTPGGDDFHFYKIKKQSIKATMIGLGSNLKPGLHHPKMTFNKEALMNGIAILYEAILKTYKIS